MQHIAVGHMQFDGVEADAHRAPRGLGEQHDDARHVVLGHGARQMPARTERQRRRRHRRPGILRGRQGLAAFPRPLRGRLAPGVRKLNRELGAADPPAMGDDPRQRRFAGVGIKPKAAMGNAALALDMGRFDDEQAGAGIRQHAEMGHVPVVGNAVIGAVLAHRRDHDAIGED